MVDTVGSINELANGGESPFLESGAGAGQAAVCPETLACLLGARYLACSREGSLPFSLRHMERWPCSPGLHIQPTSPTHR
jgi:hypothetical protein